MTEQKYIATSDTDISVVGDTADEALTDLIGLLVDAAEGFADTSEIDTVQIDVCEAVPHQWADVRDDPLWSGRDDVPDYDEVDATVYSAGRRLSRITITIRYNAMTGQWEATL